MFDSVGDRVRIEMYVGTRLVGWIVFWFELLRVRTSRCVSTGCRVDERNDWISKSSEAWTHDKV